MEKKKWVKLAGFAMVFLLSLFLCVGCSDEVKDNLVSVEFGCSGSGSRKIGTEITQSETIKPEDLYWTYTAEKKSGIYAFGASKKDGDGNLIELPVNSNLDNGKGLRGFVTKFSTGEWEFKFFGYGTRTTSGTGYTYSDKVYSGSTTFTLEASADVAHVGFRLVLEKTYTKGILEIGSNMVLSMLLEPGETIPNNSKMKFEIKEGTTPVASAQWTTITGLANGSQTFLPEFTISKKEFVASEKHVFEFLVSRDEGSGTYKAVMWGCMEVPFTAGSTTRIDKGFSDVFTNSIKPTGGHIFYVSNDNGNGTLAGTAYGSIKADGVTYAFFDANGQKLGNLSGIACASGTASDCTVAASTELYKAAYWCANGRTGYDVVYVVNLDLCPFNHEYIGFAAVRTEAFSSVVDSLLTTYGFDGNRSNIGTGRKNTMTMYSCAIESEFTQANTIWEWLSKINGRPNASPNNTKCTDWYFGGAGEGMKLAQSGQFRSGTLNIFTSTPYGPADTGCICGIVISSKSIGSLGVWEPRTSPTDSAAYRMFAVIRSF